MKTTEKTFSRFGECFCLCAAILIFSCSSEVKNQQANEKNAASDSAQLMYEYICGLWSLDSGNALSNTGYYFRKDGTLDFVSADVSGTWEFTSQDSLKIIYADFNREYSEVFNVDSIVDGRMTLSNAGGTYLYRKVPFGMNNEGTVLQGFAGSLENIKEKTYLFDIPPAKKIKLQLSSADTNVVFNVWDGIRSLTPVPVKQWTAIMVRSGKYRVTVFSKNETNSIGNGEFDLKVIGF